jgi:aspartyl-tRNA synthetase
LPILINNEHQDLVSENIRFQYRYLDLRKLQVKKLIILKSKVIGFIRNFLQQDNFIEIETPILAKPSPEGAKDFLIKTSNEDLPNHYYALPQSPQIYKQLLMMSGFQKYYQIAKCFRDEKMRGDRQIEFSQLDLEMSFIELSDLMNQVEKLIQATYFHLFPNNSSLIFKKMTYLEAMTNYGSDKPDLRKPYLLEEVDLNWVKEIFNIFDIAITNGITTIKKLSFPAIEESELLKTIKHFHHHFPKCDK